MKTICEEERWKLVKIGIDIDDVITNTSETIEEYVMKNNNSQKLQEHMKEIMKGNPSDPEVIEFCMETYLKVFQKVKLKDNAKEVIQRLLDKENEIYLITARGENLEFFKGSEKVTKEFLEDNNIKYTKIFFNAIDKAQLCIDNQIDVMIDDSIEHCEDIKNIGIKSIVFTSKVNKNIFTTIERVNNWLELEAKLDEMLKKI